MFSQWVRGSSAPLGRDRWAQTSGVWGTRSKERMARTRMSRASTGNRKRTTVVNQAQSAPFAAMAAVSWSKSAWGAVRKSATFSPPLSVWWGHYSISP